MSRGFLSRAAKKTEVMSVSVDTRRFRPGPFDLQDGVFRICFAGRLDEFKDPPLMFDVLARLHAKSMAGSSSTMSARPIPRGIRNCQSRVIHNLSRRAKS